MEKEMEREEQESTPNATEEGPEVAGGLPELSRFERHWAENPNQKSWAFKNMSAGVGHVWHMDDMGLVLQVASEDTMRLLTVVAGNLVVPSVDGDLNLRHVSLQESFLRAGLRRRVFPQPMH